MEELTQKLFNLCKQYKAKSIRIGDNQIDCYVRNKFSILGTALEGICNDIIVECKNEKDKPTIKYQNKIHSILVMFNKKYGIIVSKEKAPKTFKSTARDIYLKNEILIISINKEDLKAIIYDKLNFLECIDRKQQEIILNSKSNLVEVGLYRG